MKSISLSRYFEVIHPTYSFYKITPLKSLRNYNSDRLISLISTMYRSLTRRVAREAKKFFFKAPCKVAYYIYMERNTVEFYFIIPDEYAHILTDKIADIWKGVAVDKVDSIPMFSSEAVTYGMRYSKTDAFSLAVDKRSNALLTSLSSSISLMQKGEKVGIVYNFIPTQQVGWQAEFDAAMERYETGYPMDKNKLNGIYLLKLLGKIVSVGIEIVFNAFTGAKDERKHTKSKRELQPETLKKRGADIVEAQIMIMSESENHQRAVANAVSACEAYRVIEGDNTLQFASTKSPEALTDYRLPCDAMKISPAEGQNYITLPSKGLINEHHIACIDVMETVVPKELQNGIINIGKSSYRGSNTPAYLCNDPELRNLSLCITGSNRSGKTTLTSNIIDNCLEAGECCVVMDFCGKGELTDHLVQMFGNSVLVIDNEDYDHLQGLGYNEVDITEQDVFKKYINAKMQSAQLATLLNCVNEDDKSLKAKMDRYLECASLVVFMNSGSIKDVFSVLQNHMTRAKFINAIPESQLQNLEEYIDGLRELDQTDSSGMVVGTKFNNITGILDRLNALKKNGYFELMLKKTCDNNINLLTEIQKPQIISIKMPEALFPTSADKDIMCTYWFSKLWLSLQLRKNNIPRDQHIKVNVFIDELYQVERCQALIASKLSQMPKFTTKLIVTCHYLDQIPALREELRASNASYMILQGSNVRNFDSLKAEFSNQNFNVDDLLNLKRYQSLNLLSYENGYWAGVTQLPPPRKAFTT